MLFVTVSLALGFIIGLFWRNSPEKVRRANLLTPAGLFILLTAMGAQLGANREILSDLGQMGGQALLIASFSIAGSVALVLLAGGYIEKTLVQNGTQKNGRAGGKR